MMTFGFLSGSESETEIKEIDENLSVKEFFKNCIKEFEENGPLYVSFEDNGEKVFTLIFDVGYKGKKSGKFYGNFNSIKQR